MSTIVLRSTKGSALTFAEGDANFTNLNTDKLEDITNESIGDLSDVVTQISGTVTDVDDVRNPNTITLTGATNAGVVYNTKVRFTGSDVTSAGLALNTDYYIAAVVTTDEFELSSVSSGSPISITDPGTISDFSWNAPDLSITNNSILQWSTTRNSFVLGTQSAGVSSIDDLSDVDTTTASPSNGQVLTWNNGTSNWIPQNTQSPTVLTANLDGGGFTVSDVQLEDYKETVYSLGSTDTPTINPANGNVQTVTITSGLTLPAFTSATTGQSVTLIVSGSGTCSGIGAYRFAGGNKTLTTLSVVSIFYDGTNYFTSIATDFQA